MTLTAAELKEFLEFVADDAKIIAQVALYGDGFRPVTFNVERAVLYEDDEPVVHLRLRQP